MLAVDNDSSDCVKLLLDYNFLPSIVDEKTEDNLLCRAIKNNKK